MIVNVYTPFKTIKSGVFFDVLYTPHECWNGELYRIVLPRNSDIEGMLKEAINIYHVQIHDENKILYAPDCWLILDKNNIQIDYDSHYYGIREHLNSKILEYRA